MVTDEELCACVLAPYFDAARDRFSSFEAAPGVPLKKLARTKLLVDSAAHDSRRHFAACRPDGGVIVLAPQIIELDEENVMAIISHEFGHAADLAYPSMWVTSYEANKPALWIGDGDDKQTRKWRKLWAARGYDQCEQAADAIAFAVIGRRITYCGELQLQCFTGKERPAGLR